MSLFINPESTRGSFSFYCVRGFTERQNYVADLFRKKIEPIYGSQTEALKKMWDGRDRRTRVLCEKEKPLGVVVFKDAITTDFNLERTLEIKSLFFVDDHLEEQSKKAYFRELLNYINRFAEKNFKELPDFSMSISQEQPELLRLFEQHGFKVVKSVGDFYKRGVSQHFLRIQNNVSSSEGSRKRNADQPDMPPAKRGIRIELPGSAGPGAVQGASLQSKSALRTAGGTKQVTLKKIYIHQIREGKKTVEGRINSGQFRNIREGDIIRFFYMANAEDDVICKIVKKTAYKSFKEMLEEEDVRKCVPDCRDLDEGVAAYNAIPGYTQKARDNGVVAFRLQLLAK